MSQTIEENFLDQLEEQFKVEGKLLFISVNEIQDSILTIIAFQIIAEDGLLEVVSSYLFNHFVVDEIC